MKRFLRGIAFAGLLVTGIGMAGEVAEKPRRTENRIVIQVTEGDARKWNAVLGNIRNIQAELGPQGAAITLVAIGEGLHMLTDESLAANGVKDALNDKVRFIACGNSMKAQGVTRDELIAGVTVAQAGYVEIMRMQQEGWIYLRP
jgi:intracellular sulfur oxidation DsrE/DsrF family protein